MKKKEIIQSIKIIVLGLILNLCVSYVSAAIISPLNVGISNQAKAGGLAVGTATWPIYINKLGVSIPSTAKLEVKGVTSIDALSVWYNSILLGDVGIGGSHTAGNKLTVSGNTKVIGNMTVKSLEHTPLSTYFTKSPLCATTAGVLKVCDPVTLTVNKTGTGTGLVIAQAVGWGTLSCGTGCTSSTRDYFVRTHVELSATADSGSTFAGTSYYSGSGDGTSGWTGCDSTTNYGAKCNVNMNTSKAVTARFCSHGTVILNSSVAYQYWTACDSGTVAFDLHGGGGGGGGGSFGRGGGGGGGGVGGYMHLDRNLLAGTIVRFSCSMSPGTGGSGGVYSYNNPYPGGDNGANGSSCTIKIGDESEIIVTGGTGGTGGYSIPAETPVNGAGGTCGTGSTYCNCGNSGYWHSYSGDNSLYAGGEGGPNSADPATCYGAIYGTSGLPGQSGGAGSYGGGGGGGSPGNYNQVNGYSGGNGGAGYLKISW